MAEPILDANFHFHYLSQQKESDVLNKYGDVKNLWETNNIKKVFVTIPPTYKKIAEMLGERKDVRVGAYLSFPNAFEKTDQTKLTNFDYLKIRPFYGSGDLSRYNTELKRIIKNGNKKLIQIHVEYIPKTLMETIREFPDINFQLVHGVHAFYEKLYNLPGKEQNIDNLLELKNLFLGTSNFSAHFEIPHRFLKKAVDDGLEERIFFESDYTLGYNKGWLQDSIISCKSAINGYNKKIFFENANKLL
ncbi:MAG: hypothetical protein CVU81_00775 [Euryarchaeota archaeon HGW-Euryarchaeota-1]|nr:MAG: hypothetical protein CVU81_00775 [Euryarchaeota archaeon HGW-Euryarchaeota-1]